MPFYPGSGQAKLINTNTQKFLFQTDRVFANSVKSSIAFMLERQKSAFYPFGFAVEITFGGTPGAFEVDIQGAETDQDANYCLLGTAVTAVNTSNVARFEGVNLYPKFVRAFVKTLTNDVPVTALLTR